MCISSLGIDEDKIMHIKYLVWYPAEKKKKLQDTAFAVVALASQLASESQRPELPPKMNLHQSE